MKCTNGECEIMVEKRLLTIHQQSSCQYRIVTCPFCDENHIFKDKQVDLFIRKLRKLRDQLFNYSMVGLVIK